MMDMNDNKTEQLRMEAEQRMFSTVLRLRKEIEELYEEMEMVLNPELMLKVEKSREEMKKGELYGWKEFKEIVDG